MESDAISVVTLENFRDAIEAENILWGIDPIGDRKIKVSTCEEKYDILPAGEGFFITDEWLFILCYEFYQGVAIHLNKNEKAREIAKNLLLNLKQMHSVLIKHNQSLHSDSLKRHEFCFRKTRATLACW